MKPLQRTLAALATLLISSSLWSCHEDETPPPSATTREEQERQAPPPVPSGMPGDGGDMMDQPHPDCPMAVEGTDVSVVDTDGGVAFTFMTDAGDVADLRTRVRSMSQMYETGRGQGGMMRHYMGGEGMGHMGGFAMGGEGMNRAGREPMPAVSGTVTDTAKGAQLELRPTDPSQLDALRDQARWHQERMHSGECWMPKG